MNRVRRSRCLSCGALVNVAVSGPGAPCFADGASQANCAELRRKFAQGGALSDFLICEPIRRALS
jgi:hypothetical protein